MISQTPPAALPTGPPGRWTEVPWWQPVLYCAMAGGLGWGIRGQYGHQTGAMIAGVLVGLVLVILLCPQTTSRQAALITALTAIGVSFGGSMTYAQTIGLTHDAVYIGNWPAWRWGMIGTALKGAIWIGFAGAFLGLGLSGKKVSPLEVVKLFGLLILVHLLGMKLLNEPFDPAQRILPKIYFSADWVWTPQAALKPRYENWGGLLLGLLTAMAWMGWRWKLPLAARLGAWGMLAGAIGFPLGELIQSTHAWNVAAFRQGLLGPWDSMINWWNFMETTFGATWGAILGFGAWRNRSGILSKPLAAETALPDWFEWVALTAYCAFLVSVEFLNVRWASSLMDLALPLGLASVTLVCAGNRWPYLLSVPIVLIPIAGKTLRQVTYRDHATGVELGWILYIVVPLVAAFVLAVRESRKPNNSAAGFARIALPFCAWMYVGLNFAFFLFPWPWLKWTGRTPNAIVYFACAIGLTWLALRSRPATGAIPGPPG